MRSATSCSKTLIRSDWRRFWPLTFLYAFISFFAMPVAIWNLGSGAMNMAVELSEAEEHAQRAYQMASHIYESLSAFAVMNLFLGVGLAMILFGYLMKSNSVGLMHALPVTRTRQFLAHFAAGMSMLTAANLLTFLLSLLMEGLLGIVDIIPLLIWLLVTELAGFFFLAFGALCAMATGWLLAVPVIYFGLNFVVMAYYAVLNGIAAILWMGYEPSFVPGRAVTWLTPVIKLTGALQLHEPTRFDAGLYRKGATLFTVNPEALPTVLIYALVGVGLLALAWVLYRARHSETAGDAIVFPWLRPVVKYVISIAAGLALGTFVYEIFLNGGRHVLGLIICQVIMGGLTYCGVEMLLRKSYKIFDRRTLLGLAALWLALIAVCVCVRLDVTGYQKRVPQPEQVADVEFGCNGAYVDSEDPNVIRAMVELHRALTRQDPDHTGTPIYLSFRYGLRGGDWMARRYQADLADPAVYQALTALLNQPGARVLDLLPDRGAYGERFTGGYAASYESGQQIELTAEQCLALYHALEADADAPVKPEDLYREDWLPVELTLDTEQGSYTTDMIREGNINALALLKEYGLTLPEEWSNEK